MVDDIYARLGVQRVVNAAGNFSELGGSVLSDEMLCAMDVAARDFVDIRDLQRAVHKRLAELTKNEAAYVTSGVTAGLYLATAAAVSALHDKSIEQLSWNDIHASQVVVHRGCRTPYDRAVQQVGVSLIEVGYPNWFSGTCLDELAAAINPRTAAVLHVPARWNPAGTPTLAEVVAVARDAGVPVLVDAASQLPPTANLWQITGIGADVAIFSGGKLLQAPQATGLVVGHGALMRWISELGFPRRGIGRMFKVGREGIIAMLVAVEAFLSVSDEERLQRAEGQVTEILGMLARYPGVKAERCFPNVGGQPLPYVRVSLSDSATLAAALAVGNPSVIVGEIPGKVGNSDGFILSTLALRDSDIPTIAKAFAQAIQPT